MFECVINVSEGRDDIILGALSNAAGPSLRDLHRDAFHNRSVFTFIDNPEQLVSDVRALIDAAYHYLDLSTHEGVHPRFGIVDVVPFVALTPENSARACTLRDETAQWMAATFDVPVFLYGALANGTTRTLPEVRRGAFSALLPDHGPRVTSSVRGASAVGCRPILVAWNVWLHDVSYDEARVIASRVRGPGVRALAFPFGQNVQVSCNLIDTDIAWPSMVYDQIQSLLGPRGVIIRSELVGLAPMNVLTKENHSRWEQLDLHLDATIESRIGRVGY